MSAQDMSFAELLTGTGAFAGDGPISSWFRASEVGRIFGPDLFAYREILARAPAESSEAGRLVLALAEEDEVHDENVRFGYGILEVVAESHWDAACRNDAAELQALLFPDGLGLTGKSYAEEAGRGAARRAVLTPAVKAKLARFSIVSPAGGPTNLDAWMETHLQASSDRLSALLDQRSRTATDGAPSPAELLDTKRRFIALMNQIFSTFRILDGRLTDTDRNKLGAMKERWTDTVRSATERAKRRREARAAIPVTPRPTGGS